MPELGKSGTSGGGALSSDNLVKATSTMAGYALELLTSLTSAVFGSETARLQIFLDFLGTLVVAQDINPNATFFPQGSAAAPSIAFQGNTTANKTGWFYNLVSTFLIASVNGAQQLIVAAGSLVTMQQDTASFTMGSISQVVIGIVATFNAILASTAGNMQLGSSGAIATNAVIGFVDFPTCAGTPTGTPTRTEAGHRSMVFDTTNNKIWFFTGGVWKGVVVA